MNSRLKRIALMAMLAISMTGLAGCMTLPPDAFKIKPESLAERQLQTRRIDGVAESDLLAAAAGVLQDLGYTLSESETKLGIIVGTKDRDATDGGQVAAAIFIAMLGGGAAAIDRNQKIRVSLVTRPAAEGLKKNHLVRVTFQRTVWNTQNQITRAEPLADPELYNGFFDKLSKAVFLEAHKI